MNIRNIEGIYANEKSSAKVAVLVYLPDDKPGLRRIKKGRGFSYQNKARATINDEKVKKRIGVLAIPPAWTEVWISPKETGHLQATGRDEEGRKQYIYHEAWHETRELLNFYRMITFAEHLPKIRLKVARDHKRQDFDRTKANAIAISLLDQLHIRIGNKAYQEEHGSYGLTTLRDKHADIHGGVIHFEFIGKSGQEQDLEVENRGLAELVKKSKAIPGYNLLQYFDEVGGKHPITADDVNTYIRDVTSHDFSAKDFRTWAGTAYAYELLVGRCEEVGEKIRREHLTNIVRDVSERLGNTEAVCRKHYIHPDLLASFASGE